MQKQKIKGISPVVAISLILIVSVFAAVNFQIFYSSFQSSILTNVEKDSNEGNNILIENLIGNNLYVKADSNSTINKINIYDSTGNIVCEHEKIYTHQISNLYQWVAADTLSLTNGSQVSSWSDISGNGNLAEQPNSSFQPLFYTNLLNGKPGIRFDGVNDGMYLYTIPTGNRSVIIVSSKRGISGQVFSICRGGAIPGSFDLGIGGGIGGWNDTGDATGIITNHGNSTYIQSAIFNTNNTLVHKNGGSEISSSSTFTNAGCTSSIGGRADGSFNSLTQHADVDIYEFLIFSKDLNGNERKTIEKYLGTKYNLTTNFTDNSIENPINITQGVNTLRTQICNLNANSKYRVTLVTPNGIIDKEILYK